MKRHTRIAVTAIVTGVLICIIPYVATYSQVGPNMWGTRSVTSHGTIRYPTDNFNSAILNGFWTFEDPQGNSSVDLGARAGWLRIATTSPPLRDMISGPRIIQSNITGDFTISTRVQLSSNNVAGSAGIIVRKDSKNTVILHRTLSTNMKEQIFFGIKDGSNTTYDLPLHILDPVTLFLDKRGNAFEGSYIDANNEWHDVGTLILPLDASLDAGLSATATQEGTFVGFFDFVHLFS